MKQNVSDFCFLGQSMQLINVYGYANTSCIQICSFLINHWNMHLSGCERASLMQKSQRWLPGCVLNWHTSPSVRHSNVVAQERFLTGWLYWPNHVEVEVWRPKRYVREISLVNFLQYAIANPSTHASDLLHRTCLLRWQPMCVPLRNAAKGKSS